MVRLSLKDMIRRVEIKSEFKFESVFGFALESVQNGESVELGFQFNVKDEHFDQGLKTLVICQILEAFVYPEIMHRVHSGKLPPEYNRC